MVIFAKTVKSIDELNGTFGYTCDKVCQIMKPILENNIFETYEDWVGWALRTCIEDIPSPFSINYPSGFSLNLNPNFFTLRFPNSFAIGVRINARKEISYEVSITFFNEPKFLEHTSEYESMINNLWKVKDIKKK